MELKNKNILVTGADGFIGSHLVEELVKAGARVRALSYYNSFNNWGWLESINCQDIIEVLASPLRLKTGQKSHSMHLKEPSSAKVWILIFLTLLLPKKILR